MSHVQGRGIAQSGVAGSQVFEKIGRTRFVCYEVPAQVVEQTLPCQTSAHMSFTAYKLDETGTFHRSGIS